MRAYSLVPVLFLCGLGISQPLDSTASDSLRTSSTWPREESDWVRKVLALNPDIASQKLSLQSTRVEGEFARRGRLPQWTFTGEAAAYPDARDPVVVGGVPVLAGQKEWATEAGAGVKQVLPTGGEIEAGAVAGYQKSKQGVARDTQTVHLSARQPLWKGRGKYADPQMAVALSGIDESAAMADLRARILDIITQARTRYWNLLLKARQLQSLQADSAYWAQSMLSADAQYRLGDLSEEDFLRFRIQNLGARQSLLEGGQAFRQALEEALKLLGPDAEYPADRAYHADAARILKNQGLALDDDYSRLPAEPKPGDNAMAEHYPTVQKLARLLEKNELQRERAQNQRWPQLDLEATWNKPIEGRSDSRIAAVFSWTIPALSAGRDLRQLLLQAKIQRLDSSQAAMEVKAAMARLRDQYGIQKERFLLASEKVALERQRSLIAQRRHEMGDISFTELQLSARDRLQAEQDAATAYVALRILVAEIEAWNGESLAAADIGIEGEIP